MIVCEVCGALQSAADTEDRLQMHLEGKVHQGFQKIRDKLQELLDKRHKRGGNSYDRYRREKGRSSRSRSRDRHRREAKEKLAEEAKDHFYYSSHLYGQGSNMPKLGSLADQGRIKFSALVMQCNVKNQDELPVMEGIISLGKEWKYYKKDIDSKKRKEKEQAKREKERLEGGGSGRPPSHF